MRKTNNNEKCNRVYVFHSEIQYSLLPKKLAGENTSQGRSVLSLLNREKMEHQQLRNDKDSRPQKNNILTTTH